MMNEPSTVLTSMQPCGVNREAIGAEFLIAYTVKTWVCDAYLDNDNDKTVYYVNTFSICAPTAISGKNRHKTIHMMGW